MIIDLFGWCCEKKGDFFCKFENVFETQDYVTGAQTPGAWQPTPVFLSGKSHGQRSLVGYSPWGCKDSDTIEANEHIIMLK